MYENIRCNVIQEWVTLQRTYICNTIACLNKSRNITVMENYEAFRKYAFEEYLRTWEKA